MSGTIKIKIGASLDRSVSTVFGQVEDRAQKARTNIDRALNRSSAGVFRGTVTAAERADRDRVKSAQKAAREIERTNQKLARASERSAMQQARAAETAAKVASRAHTREVERFATRTSHRATRFFWGNAPIMHHAGRVANDILRGAGVDFSVQGSVSRAVALQSTATKISSAGYFKGAAGPAGIRQDPNKIQGEARDIGTKLGFNPQDILEGLDKFVAKTGNLKEGRDIIRDMAELAGATGSSLEDTVDAAGDVSQALGDIPDKGTRITAIMHTIAAQGKLGAVEMKNMATQMAKVGASATQFEGDAGKNIIELGALVQLARQKGGATSATQSATAIAGMTNILKTPKRIKEFRALDIDVIGKTGQIRDPIEIIKESISKTKGDPLKLKKMFANVVGAKPVEALATTYRQAGGGAKGMAAVDAAVNQLVKATLLESEIAEANAARLKTTAAKAQIFQNNMDKIAAAMADRVLPQFEKLAPTILSAVESFGNLIAWAAENPGSAVVAALVASIARAGIESAVRGALERVILGSGPRVPLPIPGGGAGGAGGAVGGAAGVGLGAAVGAAALGTLLAVDQAASLNKEVQGTGHLADVLPGFNKGKFSIDNLFSDAINPFQAPGRAGKVLGGLVTDTITGDDRADTKAKGEALKRNTGMKHAGEAVSAAVATMGTVNAVIDPTSLIPIVTGITSKTLNVHVMNPKDIGSAPRPTGAPLNGRDAPPA